MAGQEPEITPAMITYQGERDMIYETTTREGTLLVGHDARTYVMREFARVMAQSDLDRNERVRDYCRITDQPVTLSLRMHGRNQGEHADATALILSGLGLTDQPFSVDTSQALIFPSRIPEDFGDAGPATV